jgi:hypothetical protein
MGLFSRKDWNIVAIMFETRQKLSVNGNRGKGKAADTIRANVQKHDRTIYWAVFDQNGAFLEGDAGAGSEHVSKETLTRLTRELPRLKTVREVLTALESGKVDKAAKVLDWPGYGTGPAQ